MLPSKPCPKVYYKEDNLRDLESPGFDHDLQEAMDIFRSHGCIYRGKRDGQQARSQHNTTKPDKAQRSPHHTSRRAAPIAPSCYWAESCPPLGRTWDAWWGETDHGRWAWLLTCCIPTKNCCFPKIWGKSWESPLMQVERTQASESLITLWLHTTIIHKYLYTHAYTLCSACVWQRGEVGLCSLSLTWICSALSAAYMGFDWINLIGKCIVQTAVTEVTSCISQKVKELVAAPNTFLCCQTPQYQPNHCIFWTDIRTPSRTTLFQHHRHLKNTTESHSLRAQA